MSHSHRTIFYVTCHCFTGCMIGETLGLMIGISLGWSVAATIALAVVLAFVVGVSLAIYTVMEREGLSWMDSLKRVWLGEVVSISVMELVMNVTDYHMGGVSVQSLADPLFWQALAVAGIAGFVAAYPVNGWLLRHSLKSCGH